MARERDNIVSSKYESFRKPLIYKSMHRVCGSCCQTVYSRHLIPAACSAMKQQHSSQQYRSKFERDNKVNVEGLHEFAKEHSQSYDTFTLEDTVSRILPCLAGHYIDQKMGQLLAANLYTGSVYSFCYQRVDTCH